MGRGRQQKILAALLLDANRSVSTDRLADVIWGDRAPATAHKQVQNSVGLLRTALRAAETDTRIESRYGGYRLEVPEDQVDSLVFRRGCSQAEAAVRHGDVDQAARTLESSLGLWRGAALEDIESHLLAANASELEERRLQAVKTLVRLRFTQGRQAETIGDLFRWTAGHPYQEELHCQLAEALHCESRTGEALRVLGQLRDRLRRDLGTCPDPATRSLEQRLAHAEPATDGSAATDGDLVAALLEVSARLAALTAVLQGHQRH